MSLQWNRYALSCRGVRSTGPKPSSDRPRGRNAVLRPDASIRLSRQAKTEVTAIAKHAVKTNTMRIRA